MAASTRSLGRLFIGSALLSLSCLAVADSASSDYLPEATRSHVGRSLQATSQVTIAVKIQDSCLDPYSWVDLSDKNAQGYRGECGVVGGGSAPCTTTSSDGNPNLNYTVNQGDSLVITFKGFNTTYVFLGGALNDGFLNTPGCYITTQTAAATSNPITPTTDTGLTFKPTGAVCSQFIKNTIANLNVLAFDAGNQTRKYDSTNNVFSAAACKFEIGLVIVANPQNQLSPDQLFPLTDGAAALPGSMLQMLGMALLGAVIMLAMLH